MIDSGYRLFVFCLLAGLIECNRDICGEPHLLQKTGTISSPFYPRPYPSDVECIWTVLKPPGSRLTLFILDFDTHEDIDCKIPPCCDLNHLSLQANDSEIFTNYCGQLKPRGPLHFKKNLIIIKFKSLGTNLRSRGFNLSYIIAPVSGKSNLCRDDEFQCHTHGCIPYGMQCDGMPQCSDASDELECPTDCILKGKSPCDPSPESMCFDNRTQRCNGAKDCPSGIDELGCGHCEHSCRTSGCFSSLQRCNGVQDCADFTDELGCGPCKSDHAWCNRYTTTTTSCFLPSKHHCDGINHCPDGEDEFGCDCEDSESCSGRHCRKICNNAKCLHPSLWCDGNDDCGDNSDEENCIRNSLISATIMGCLFCGLMLVIAVMCALRIYSIRHEAANYRLALPQHIASRLRYNGVADGAEANPRRIRRKKISDSSADMTNSISLPAMDDEFFHREPPPAYADAVAQGDLSMTGIAEVEPSIRRSRTRRHRMSRPAVKPPTPPPSSETSNQSSPSRDSITSSSYLSNDDSAHLIGT